MILGAFSAFSVLRIIVTGAAAYFAACRIESIWARVFGIGYLGCMSIMTFAVAVLGDVVALLLFLALTSAAIHAWFYTRV